MIVLSEPPCIKRFSPGVSAGPSSRLGRSTGLGGRRRGEWSLPGRAGGADFSLPLSWRGLGQEVSFFCSKKSIFRPDYGFLAPQKRYSGRIAEFLLRKTGLPAGLRIFRSAKPTFRPDYGIFTPQKPYSGRIAEFWLRKNGLLAGARFFWSKIAAYALITHRQSRFLPG